MSSYEKAKKFKQLAFVVNVLLLLIHATLLSVFAKHKVWIMVGMNIISVIIYLGCFYTIKSERLQTYIVTIYSEIIMHMLLALICLGWTFGFELYAFAVIPTCYFGVYATEDIMKRRKYAFEFSVGVFATFLAARVYTYTYGPLYEFNDSLVQIIFYIINASLSFGFMIYYLQRYTSIVLDSEAALKMEASIDSLTEIYNRRKMQSVLDVLFKNAEQTKQHFTVSILDIDHFKEVNDTFGHDSGDYILKRVARMLTIFSQNSEHKMIVGRWGGEEFLIIQMYDDSPEESLKRLEHIRYRIMKHRFIHEKKAMNITVTIGMAHYEKNISMEDLLRKADQNLYVGKRKGKNKIVV